MDGRIVALRPVAVEAADYAAREYGATVAELEHFERRTHAKSGKARKEGKIREFTGNIEAIVSGHGH